MPSDLNVEELDIATDNTKIFCVPVKYWVTGSLLFTLMCVIGCMILFALHLYGYKDCLPASLTLLGIAIFWILISFISDAKHKSIRKELRRNVRDFRGMISRNYEFFWDFYNEMRGRDTRRWARRNPAPARPVSVPPYVIPEVASRDLDYRVQIEGQVSHFPDPEIPARTRRGPREATCAVWGDGGHPNTPHMD